MVSRGFILSASAATAAMLGTSWTHCRESTEQPKSRKHRVLVIGGGTAGITVSSQILRSEFAELSKGSSESSTAEQVAIVEPSAVHYYQPLWSMIGAGLFQKEASRRPMEEIIPRKSAWIQDSVVSFTPQQNYVSLKSGDKVYYDYLVVATGLKSDWGKIPGLEQGLKDEHCPVVSTHDYESSAKTYKVLSGVQTGNVIFTMPREEYSFASTSSQKIMWLWKDIWKSKLGTAVNVTYATPYECLFKIPKYDEVLQKLANEQEISVLHQSELIAIDPKARLATFTEYPNPGGWKGGKTFTLPFDALHVVPPQTAPGCLGSSPLAGPDGLVAVDHQTLQHKQFQNVFAIGDCCSLPTSKSAAGIASQAPVVVHNLLQLEKGLKLTGKYDGYAGCPIHVGRKQVLLAEFAYNQKLHETFTWQPLFDQKYPSTVFYYLQTDFFPWVYWYGFIRVRKSTCSFDLTTGIAGVDQ